MKKLPFAVFAAISLLVTAFAGTHSDTGLTVREKTIVCFGDSLTAGEQSDRVTIANAHFNYGNMNGKNQWMGYPLVLQELLGDEWDVVSVAKGGATTSSVLAYQGAQPMALAADLALPADTTPVEVTAGRGMLNGGAAIMVPDTCFTELSVWNTKDPSMTTMGSITGALPDGTRIRWRDNAYTELHDIARLTAGEAKTYPAGTLFTPDSATHFTDCIQVIFTGQTEEEAAGPRAGADTRRCPHTAAAVAA